MIYEMLRPLLMKMDAEMAHKLTLRALRLGIIPKYDGGDRMLEVKVFGLSFPNPLGLAAGFDKDAQVLGPLLDMGFGCVELGTVTPLPQPGNGKPRVFRDIDNKTVINRMGFPGLGFDAFSKKMRSFHGKHDRPRGRIGINIGVNKDSPSPVEDYKAGISFLAAYADYITINISSPNTAGLRDLQAREELDKLLDALITTRNRDAKGQPLLLKVAPDLDAEQRGAVAELVLKHGIDGLIVGNTTVTRPRGLDPMLVDERGGLSGELLKELSTQRIADFYKLLGGKMPIIGVGGISSAQDAYDKIRAGASLLQLYTGLIFEGPQLIPDILQGLNLMLARDGFKNVSEAVGCDAEKVSSKVA